MRADAVGELIEILNKVPADTPIGIKAACCGHVHDVDDVEFPSETDGFEGVVFHCS